MTKAKPKTRRAKARKAPTKTAPTKARAGRGGTSGTKRQRDLARLAEMMAGIDFCMMTTHGEGGSFHSRPMSNNGEVEFDGDSWFFTWKKTAKVDELAKDGRVSLSLVGGTKKAPLWIAISGHAEIVDHVVTKKKLWQPELEQWFDDGPEDPNVVLLKVRAERASYWSFDDEGEVDLRGRH